MRIEVLGMHSDLTSMSRGLSPTKRPQLATLSHSMRYRDALAASNQDLRS